ncbi:MAG: type II toxin-antitoxin system VapC family toxin [Spirochaetales bacterium]|nr:type II toxin-antitoxin system VapC family toxin [Spirochaetales bacterium]
MYLIDTNICIYLIKKQNQDLRVKVEQQKPFDIAISAISVAELEYGVAKSKHTEKNRIALQNFLSSFEIIPFDDIDAEQFGIVRAYFEKMGQQIGTYDLEIASQALARGYIVVTNNEKEFRRVPGLKVENWV